MRHAALGIALLMAAGSSSAETASGDMFGTDAHLAPLEPDAVLRYADHPRGFAELRLPEGDGPFPLAVIFHGGCWKTGVANQAYMAPLATRWQGQGIATLNVDYREVGDGGGWPGSFEDWQASAALIDRAATAHPIDRARVTLVGHSAGALPAQWLATAQGEGGPLGARAPLAVRAAIVLDGPADVGAEREAFDVLCEFSSVDPFMGGDPARVPARYAAIAPASYAPRLEELLFVQAVLPPPPTAAQAAIRAGGARLEVRENPGASHFAILTPGSETYTANEPAMLRVLRGGRAAR
ncbi:alpha/beta hydrolase family protein [Pelagerythrobacter aerophilus]|uniref:Alpha/beta hydrolase n=1 Tax=Pelagerythrobacter aerophilus TaxID=2306995 RepID=A0A418NMJ5_9SPHN|nr:alpha/beta hydrolase [Pelagerythrobacter aerophilus]RIV81429.1 alpha/beta hydrolase [Pelagerythrobacter aerophilus]